MGIILTCDIGTTACAAFNVDGTKISDVRIEYTTEYPRPGWAEAYAHVYDVFRQVYDHIDTQGAPEALMRRKIAISADSI